MFDFIKKLFKKPEPDQETVSLDNLKSFFKSKKTTALEPLNQHILQFYDDIKAELESLKPKIPVLESAELSKDDKKMPAKVKNIVEGHRQNYAKRTRLLLEHIDVPDDVNEIQYFIKDLDKELDEYSKATFKSYRAAQHLYFKPVEDIAKSIKNINSKLKSLKDLFEKYNLAAINQLGDNINSLFKQIALKDMLCKEYKDKQMQLLEQQKLLDKKKKEFESLKKSQEFKRYDSFVKERERLNTQLKQIEFSIIDLFSDLERGLRKYGKIAVDSRTINTYLTNPVVALINDKEKNILAVLTGLKNSVHKLNLGDKKSDKTVEVIDEAIEANTLDKLQDNYNTIFKQIADTEQKLNDMDVMAKAAELDKAVRNLEFSIKKKSESIEEPDDDKQKELLEEIKDKFFKAFNIKLEIR